MMTMWCFELRRISDGSTYSAKNIRTMIRAKVTTIIVTTLLETYLDHDDENENDHNDQNENDNDDKMSLSTVAIAKPDGRPSSFSAAKVSGEQAGMITRRIELYDKPGNTTNKQI